MRHERRVDLFAVRMPSRSLLRGRPGRQSFAAFLFPVVVRAYRQAGTGDVGCRGSDSGRRRASTRTGFAERTVRGVQSFRLAASSDVLSGTGRKLAARDANRARMLDQTRIDSMTEHLYSFPRNEALECSVSADAEWRTPCQIREGLAIRFRRTVVVHRFLKATFVGSIPTGISGP